ncbi:hypothetical protein D9619_008035 [Psilocybe cf. subviscida]|uniref:Uncharacterized protein n=1 Tax=Psilocybe cf. subviscida TaxID=2480587 RepID=A0A8H5ET77_9AGAR|nr:hypothetical protein D9619_008035 [Psilocybe cf. subviscida]
MDNSNDKMRKRDIIKSKLGLSSRSQEGPSSLHDAIAPSITSSLSMTPAVSQAHKDAFYPTPPPTQGAQNEEETRYRAPATPGSWGDRKHPIANRLNPPPPQNPPQNKGDGKNQNANKLQGNQTGGKSGK